MNSIGDIIFQGYPSDTFLELYEVLILSFISGFNINIYFSNDKSILYYTSKVVLHVVLMKLAKTMNVWIFLSICFGQGARYVFDNEIDIFVKYILNNVNVN